MYTAVQGEARKEKKTTFISETSADDPRVLSTCTY